jgi:AcrR family transcriptional regulator
LARKSIPHGNRGATRREEYAEATRRAIIEAARELFVKRGYFATKVEDIAALARVAPVTVYSAAGGKHELLRTLMDRSTMAPIVDATLRRVQELDDPRTIVHLVANGVRTMREEFGDIMYLMLVTAPHDQTVAENLAIATARYREAFVPIARRLMDLGALRDGMDLQQAVDVFWFYLGYWGLFTLRNDNGWTYTQAERWLRDAACQALLRGYGPQLHDEAADA